jgi:hypothetical protein
LLDTNMPHVIGVAGCSAEGEVKEMEGFTRSPTEAAPTDTIV